MTFCPEAFCLYCVFVLWHFFSSTFGPVTFCLVAFCLGGILSCDILPLWRFVLGTFSPMTFCPMVFCLMTFGIVTFCPGHYVRKHFGPTEDEGLHDVRLAVISSSTG